ncbi:MAG: dienelactone hydrolase family protein [Saprospiraceae bacterium]|nr:dienelactone hydrolase family protein [Saprospiraceae bacterium]
MKIKLLASLFFCLSISIMNAQKVIPLYEGIPAGSETWTWDEKENTQNMFNTKIVYNVSKPSLTAYLPNPSVANGTAVIVAPGGAFHTLSIESEGIDVAKWLNSRGVAAFVLKYRVVHSTTDDPVRELMGKMGDFKKLDAENDSVVTLAMRDGLTAVKYVRSHASEINIDPNKIGFMGFSAGGTLTMSVVYNGTEADRPNFVAPIYAYEKAIIGSTPPSVKTPIFVCAASDDQLGLAPHSANIYSKWLAAQQPAELHIFEKGGHGFGMRKNNIPTDRWIDRFEEWLYLHGLIKEVKTKIDDRDDYWRAVDLRNRSDFGFLNRYKADNQKLPVLTEKETRVVFLGNSITEGWVRADSNFFIRNNYVGRGISGQTTPQMLLRFRQDVLDLKPKVLVISAGINDIAENSGPYDENFTFGNIQSMVEIAKANKVKVVIASIHPAFEFPWRKTVQDVPNKVIRLNERLKAYAQAQNLVYLDYHTPMKDSRNGMGKEMAADGIHPTLAGYKVMAPLAQKAIEEALKKK